MASPYVSRYEQLLRRSLDRMAGMAAIGNAEPDDNDDFMEGFRAYRQTGATAERPKPVYALKVICLNGPMSVVRPVTARRLKTNNLGSRKIIVRRRATMSQLNTRIMAEFPVLTGQPYTFQKSRKENNYILAAVEANTVGGMKAEIGRGALYVVPDQNLDLPTLGLTQPSRTQLTTQTSTTSTATTSVAVGSMGTPRLTTPRLPTTSTVSMVTPRLTTLRLPTSTVTTSVVSMDLPTLDLTPPSRTRLTTQTSTTSTATTSVAVGSMGTPRLTTPRLPTTSTVSMVTPRLTTLRLPTSTVTTSVVSMDLPTLDLTPPSRTRLTTPSSSTNTLVSDMDQSDHSYSVSSGIPTGTPSDIPTGTPSDIPTGTPTVTFRRREVETAPIAIELDQQPSVEEQLNEEVETALAILKSYLQDREVDIIRVNRTFICRDVLDFYDSNAVLEKRVSVDFIGELGADLGGLTKDMFSVFWTQACQEYFKGESASVPYLPVHRRSEADTVYPAVGRVICHMLMLVGELPTQLCRSTLLSMARPDLEVPDSFLLEDFFLYVSHAEASLLKRAMSTNSLNASEQGRMMSLFHCYGMHVLPSIENLRSQVVDIARSELLDNPLRLAMLMRRGFSQFSINSFFAHLSPQLLSNMYSCLRPTGERVAQAIKADSEYLRPEEDVALFHLDSLVRELPQEKLEAFLLFVTGSTVLPMEGIKISFNASTGLSRAPVAHTCSNLLELPVAYDSYQDFKREWSYILSDTDAFKMSLM